MSGEIPAFQNQFRVTAEGDFVGMLQRYLDSTVPIHEYRIETDRAKLVAGTLVYYQDIAIYAGQADIDANEKGVLCNFSVSFFHKLAGALDETPWEGDLGIPAGKKHLLLEAFADPDWWLVSSSHVAEVVSDPVVSNNGRTGDIMHFDVGVELLLDEI